MSAVQSISLFVTHKLGRTAGWRLGVKSHDSLPRKIRVLPLEKKGDRFNGLDPNYADGVVGHGFIHMALSRCKALGRERESLPQGAYNLKFQVGIGMALTASGRH